MGYFTGSTDACQFCRPRNSTSNILLDRNFDESVRKCMTFYLQRKVTHLIPRPSILGTKSTPRKTSSPKPPIVRRDTVLQSIQLSIRLKNWRGSDHKAELIVKTDTCPLAIDQIVSGDFLVTTDRSWGHPCYKEAIVEANSGP